MRKLGIILAVVYIFFVFTAPSTADTTSLKVRSDDRDLIIFEDFAFTDTGLVSVYISSVSVTPRPVTSKKSRPDPSRIGFYLISEDGIGHMYYENISCDLDSMFIELLFTFDDFSPSPHSSFNETYDVPYPGLYTLKFANCNPRSHVKMDVWTEFYNTINDTTTTDYLSAEQRNLPSLYFDFSVIYTCFLVFWIFVCFKYNSSVHQIHLLMGQLLVMKGLNLLCAIKVLQSMKVTGNIPHGWGDLLYIIEFIRTVLFYTVIAAIFQGKIVLIALIPLQVIAATKMIVQVLSKDTMPTDWISGLLMAEDLFFCLLLVLISIAICKSSRTNQAVENHLKKFTLFLRVLCVYWLIDVFAGAFISIDDSYGWSKAAEIATLALYMVMFYMFRPSEENR